MDAANTPGANSSATREAVVQRWRKAKASQPTPTRAVAALEDAPVAENTSAQPAVPQPSLESAVVERSNANAAPERSRLNLIPSAPEAQRSHSAVTLASYQTPQEPSAPKGPAMVPPAPNAAWRARGEDAARMSPSSVPDAPRGLPEANVQGPRATNSSAPRSLIVREITLGTAQDPVANPPANAAVPQLPPVTLPGAAQPSPELSAPRGLQDLPTPVPREALPPAAEGRGSGNPGLSLPPVQPPQRAIEPLSPPRRSEGAAVPNPFPAAQDPTLDSPLGDSPLGDSPSDREPLKEPGSEQDDLPPVPPSRNDRVGSSCDAIRTFAATTDIRNVKVDSSPSFVQGFQGKDRTESYTKESFIEKSRNRTWRSATGEVVAEGRLVDLVYGTVIIEREDGSRISYLQRKLSDPDQVFVAESWGVPTTCSIGTESVHTRNFASSTMTWKASGACHKPLYFQDVQLERYGHEMGPIAQPVASTLRFFGDIAILPYKMGIHPPNECQYPLGYYRPGSCAPWTVGPVPISLRGAVEQAKFVTGAVFVLP